MSERTVYTKIFAIRALQEDLFIDMVEGGFNQTIEETNKIIKSFKSNEEEERWWRIG